MWFHKKSPSELVNVPLLEEIFKKLCEQDRKEFRVTNQTIWKATLPYWRRSRSMSIVITSTDNPEVSEEIYEYRDHPPSPSDVFTMKKFMELAYQGRDQSEEVPVANANPNGFNYQLLEHPFRRYYLSYNGSSYPLRTENIDEAQFWEAFGSKVTYLTLCNVNCEEEEAYAYQLGHLLLEHCNNLEELDTTILADYDKRVMTSWEKKEDLFANGNKVAEKLHTVDAQCTGIAIHKLYKFLPNLKTLSTSTNDGGFGEITKPTVNGDRIKLEKLTIHDWEFDGKAEFSSLRKYIELVLDSLKHLEINDMPLTSIREEPYDLYAALSKCQSLETLRLNIQCQANNVVGDGKWFRDLSIIEFPKLKRFQLFTRIHYGARARDNQERPVLRFDFGTLKGMPLLETLEITEGERKRYESFYEKKPISEEWIFQDRNGIGRNLYKPEGVEINYRYSEADSITSNNLKNFTFVGFPLNAEDLRAVSDWFPNLTYLNVAIDLGYKTTLPDVFEDEDSFENLKTLVIQSKNPIAKADLKSLKRNRRCLKIFQELSGSWSVEAVVGPNENVDFKV